MNAIQIEINDRRKVFTVRELFSNEFPNLKLEFYAKPHTGDGPHSDKIVQNSRLTIGDCRTADHDGTLEIQPGMTIPELKNHLSDTFGLKAEVYQRTGSSWQPADPGKLTLEELSRLSGTSL